MRCVIITGGTIEDLQWLSGVIKEGDRLICVDAGARYAAALKLIPDIIIGDMDSLAHRELDRLAGLGAAVREYPADKDDTDTALALAEALTASPEEIIIVGALGTRFDHSLANVHLLRVALDWGVRARILNEYNEITLVSPLVPAVVDGRPGDLFSLLPLTEAVTGVNVKGARWPLENATFRIGNPYGVSNRLAAGKVDISVDSGLMLLIRTSGGLWQMEKKGTNLQQNQLATPGTKAINVSFQVIPNVPGGDVYGVVDRAIEVVQRSGVKYEVGPMETTMEGELNELLEVVKKAQQACVEAGAVRVMTLIKIDYSPGGVTMAEKVGKYR